MSEPFIAEVRIMAFNFPPRGWAECDGQILPINQNQSLYSLLGTTYGGDGRTSFALPDLRGRTPVHKGRDSGQNYTMGQKSGQETHTLSVNEMPQHKHTVNATSETGDQRQVANNILASNSNQPYGNNTLTDMSPVAVSNVGGNQAHENMQPYITLNFCISLRGLFPSRN